jgi:hypothetical protein
MCSSYANSYLITILKTDLESPPTGLHLQIWAKWYKILGAIGPRDVYMTAHVTWADLGLGLVNHGCQVSVFKSKLNCGDPAYRSAGESPSLSHSRAFILTLHCIRVSPLFVGPLCNIFIILNASSCSVGAPSLRNPPGSQRTQLAIKRCIAICHGLGARIRALMECGWAVGKEALRALKELETEFLGKSPCLYVY